MKKNKIKNKQDNNKTKQKWKKEIWIQWRFLFFISYLQNKNKSHSKKDKQSNHKIPQIISFSAKRSPLSGAGDAPEHAPHDPLPSFHRPPSAPPPPRSHLSRPPPHLPPDPREQALVPGSDDRRRLEVSGGGVLEEMVTNRDARCVEAVEVVHGGGAAHHIARARRRRWCDDDVFKACVSSLIGGGGGGAGVRQGHQSLHLSLHRWSKIPFKGNPKPSSSSSSFFYNFLFFLFFIIF